MEHVWRGRETPTVYGQSEVVQIPLSRGEKLEGELMLPDNAIGVVLLVHVDGLGRRNEHARGLARILRRAAIGSLAIDLCALSESERGRSLELGVSTERVLLASHWLRKQPRLRGLRVGYYGAGQGAAAMIRAAALESKAVAAIIARGGQLALAADVLTRVVAPTLLIVPGADEELVTMHREALAALSGPKRLELIPGATRHFGEPNAQERVQQLTTTWLSFTLRSREDDAEIEA